MLFNEVKKKSLGEDDRSFFDYSTVRAAFPNNQGSNTVWIYVPKCVRILQITENLTNAFYALKKPTYTLKAVLVRWLKSFTWIFTMITPIGL